MVAEPSVSYGHNCVPSNRISAQNILLVSCVQPVLPPAFFGILSKGVARTIYHLGLVPLR